MFNKIKNFFKSNKTIENKGLESIDNENWKNMRLNKKGGHVISFSMKFHIEQMAQQFPEWNGLFEVSVDHNEDVVVKCLKGFNNAITKQALPCLWRRKSFIENCILVGVDKIIFIDPIDNVFDLLEVDKIDASKLP